MKQNKYNTGFSNEDAYNPHWYQLGLLTTSLKNPVSKMIMIIMVNTDDVHMIIVYKLSLRNKHHICCVDVSVSYINYPI